MTIRFPIRARLLLLSLAVLSIPYVGYQYLGEVERYLRENFETTLQDTAIAIATPLHQHPEMFPVATGAVTDNVFVHELPHAMQLDGYTDDWLSWIGWSNTYTGSAEQDLSFRFIISRHQQYYFALLQVHDPERVLRSPGIPYATDNDHVTLSYARADGRIVQLYFSPSDNGEFTPFEILRSRDEFGFPVTDHVYRTNVSAVWRNTESGYNLEISLPVSEPGGRLGILVTDVDDVDTRKVRSVLGTAGATTPTRPGNLLRSSPEIMATVGSYARMEGRRIWVLDQHGQVLASMGNLLRDLSAPPVNLLYRLLLPPVHEVFTDDLSGASRLRGEEIAAALDGRAASRWRSSPDGRAIIVSAAAPVISDGRVRGVVMVEETTGSIQIQQRRAMATLFNKTLLVFMVVTLLLLAFASRLSIRIRRLERQAEAAIDAHGRVVGSFTESRAGDEIGDLSRRFAAMLDRLRHYNSYLENLAGRLAHELRTPITVVQSSLEHVNDVATASDRETYLQRAREGIERLNLIVVRLSEATRLEQTLETAERHTTDISALLSSCVESYRMIWPGQQFRLNLPERPVTESVAADLIVQMLDKLVRNAIDFHTPDTGIVIDLSMGESDWSLSVINEGTPLPAGMAGQLFNSMVSIRSGKGSGGPHLGLGLYIVRLIAQFHGGEATASNLAGDQGVRISVRCPATAVIPSA